MTRRLALCGVLCALGVVILSLGSLIPAATFCCPVLASLTLLILLPECGTKYALLAYAATACLGLLLAPDREAAALYLALGYYPVLQARLDRLPKGIGWVCRLLWFNVSVLAVYAALLFVFWLDGLRQELFGAGRRFAAALLLGGNLVFILYDFALRRLAVLLQKKLSRKGWHF